MAACVIWFTGLSGAGKSTLAQAMSSTLEGWNLPVEHLDGDKVREIFPQTGFDRHSRNDHIRKMGFVSSKLEKHGVFVIASFISPYRESRDFVRNLCRNFIEVYLSTPLKVCEGRDPKGLYRKVREGEIVNFTGVHDPYEPPVSPELVLDTSGLSVEESVQCILDILRTKDFLPASVAVDML